MKTHQFVKTYSTHNTVESAVAEINQDLIIHRDWSIVSLALAMHNCIVVYAIDDQERDIKDKIVPFPGLIVPNRLVTPSDNILEACKTCPHRDGPKDIFGNPCAGDSPCQWCQHYPWRMTNITSTMSPWDKM